MSFCFVWPGRPGSKEDLDLMTPTNTCRSSKSRRRLFKKYTRKVGHDGTWWDCGTFDNDPKLKSAEGLNMLSHCPQKGEMGHGGVYTPKKWI